MYLPGYDYEEPHLMDRLCKPHKEVETKLDYYFDTPVGTYIAELISDKGLQLSNIKFTIKH